MDRIREVVAEVEKALGSAASSELVESISSIVLERLTLSSSSETRRRAVPEEPTRAIVTAVGRTGGSALAIVSSILNDCGASIEDVSQSSGDGGFALVVEVDLSRISVTLGEMRRRLLAAAASRNIRISIHPADLYHAMTTV